jgi:type I restriction enzyme S subunit
MVNVNLPPGWVWTTVDDIAHLIRGVSYKKDEASGLPKEGLVPILRATNIQDERLILYSELVYVPKVRVKREQELVPGDVVICISSGSKHLVGKAAQLLSEWNGSFGTFCMAARFSPGVNPRYAGYFFSSPSYRREIQKKSSGININNLRSEHIGGISFPLPPLPEQERIVARIESLFTQLDAGVAALKRAQAALKRYKASVLKAACEGRLVRQEAGDESAEVMLRRMGKEPLTGEGLGKLPEGWCWVKLETLAANEPYSITDGPFGSNLKTEHYTEVGPRVVRLQNIGEGIFYNADAHISLEHFDYLRKHQVHSGDIVIAALGESLPRACIIPSYLGQAIVKADCIRLKPNTSITNSRYLNIALNSDTLRKLASKIVHGVGRPRLNQAEIKSLQIPLPHINEQLRIATEVERRLSVVQELDQTIEANLKRAGRLRQAVLKMAFEGRLVS